MGTSSNNDASLTFCEFLISKRIVSQADLVKCLLKQQMHQPSLVEFVRNNSWLSDADIFNILNEQSRSELDFKSAAKKLDLWIPEWDEKLRIFLHKNQPGLFEILLKEKIVDSHTLTAALDEFLRNKTDNATQLSSIDISRLKAIARAVKGTGVLTPEQNLSLLDGISDSVKDIKNFGLCPNGEADPILEQIEFYRSMGLKPGPSRLNEWLRFILTTARTHPNSFQDLTQG